MGAAAVPISTAIGLYQQGQARGAAYGDASAQQNLMNAANRRRQMIFDQMQGLYDQQFRDGAFNPSGELQTFRDQFKIDSGIAANNLAAAARTAGYRPGDTAPMESLAGQQVAQGLHETMAEQQIRRDAADRQRAALAQLAGVGENMYGNQAAMAQNQYNTDINYARSFNPAPLISKLSNFNWASLGGHTAAPTQAGTDGMEFLPVATTPHDVSSSYLNEYPYRKPSLGSYFAMN